MATAAHTPIERNANDSAKGFTFLLCFNRFFFQFNLNIYHRFWLIIPFGVALICCAISIEKTWIRWGENLITVSHDKVGASTLSAPFPKIAVCPKIKVSKDKLDLKYAYHQLKTLKEKNNLTDLE